MSSNYKGGRIIRLKVENFMTYNDLEFFPEPGLNIIVGPNGSGKSSIMCAICLGLGGKPTFTGRNLHLSDYVKHGYDNAVITVELDDPDSEDGSLVITREIQLNGSSFFWMKGKLVKGSEVEKQVTRFNIHVNNLCQFLPQEKVSEFSKMSPKQLLKSIQQAVCYDTLYKLYEELLNLQKAAEQLESQVKTQKEEITEERRKSEILQPEVQVYEDKKNYQERIQLLEEKRPTLEYRVLYDKKNQQKAEANEAKQKVLQFREQEIDPLEDERNMLKDQCKKHTTQLNSEDAEAQRVANLVWKSFMAVADISYKISEAHEAFLSKVSESQAQIQKEEELANDIAKSKKNFNESLEMKQEIEEELIAVEPQSKAATMNLIAANSACEAKDNEISECQLHKKRLLEKLNDRENRKVEYLKTHYKDTYTAWCWLNENRHLFQRNVVGPLLMLIKVPDARNMKFLESHIPDQDMVLFICEDQEDAKLFVKTLCAERKLVINVACAPSQDLSKYQPSVPEVELKTFRFHAYLKDLFEAPDVVMSFLCENYNIHNTPVGDSKVEEFVHTNISTIPFARFYTPEASYAVKTSKYGECNISCTSSQIGHKGVLSMFASTSEDETRRIEDELANVEAKLAELKTEKEALDNEKSLRQETYNKFQKKKEKLLNLKETLKKEEVKIRNLKEILRNSEQQQIDLSAEKDKMESVVSRLRHDKITLLHDLHMHLQKRFDILQNKVYLQCCEASCSEKAILVGNLLIEKSSELAKLEQDCKAKEQAYANTYASVKRQLEIAEKKCGIRLKDDGVIKFNKKYGHLPSELGALDEELNRLKARVECMGDTDETVIQDYENHTRLILQKERKLEETEVKLENVRSQMQAKRQEWLKPLEELIAEISETFSRYFEDLGWAGELCLCKGENENDFEAYGLSIQVKYHESTPLIELSQAHHSGGECSVATVMFMHSLQQLVEVPFRCVDEINQGMDSVNERRVFELLSLSSEKSSQYFLLTPKLLPDLPYSSSMKIHIIHNGPALRFTSWDLEEIFERNSQLRETEN